MVCLLGEVTFLSYTHYFHSTVISAWSSGTGGAGVLGTGYRTYITTEIGVVNRRYLLRQSGRSVNMS
jgi:battenin